MAPVPVCVRAADRSWDGQVEIVEHKGVGHPDTICDALAETLSVALSREYLERFGAVLHHNVDKALLRGGASRTRFGGGEVIAPIQVFLAGRATEEAHGQRVPVAELAVEGTRAWLRRNLHALDAHRHVEVTSLLRPGSRDLVELFARQARAGTWLANDTSFGAGFAPSSELERTVLAVGDALRALAEDAEHRHVGEDVKVMGVRHDGRVSLTVACAFVDAFVASLADYEERRRALVERLRTVASEVARVPVEVRVNAADDPAKGSVYLTVTGTSAEAGDDGQVGRGNRVGGLITPYRSMTLEAAAGKNPVSHVGKLYNVAARRMAWAIVEGVSGVTHAECVLVSEIGRPVAEPRVVDVRVGLADERALSDVAPRVEAIARAEVARIDAIGPELIAGAERLF